MTDYHIHIGQFNDVYYDALEIFSVIESCSEKTGIDKINYSTTSTCRDDVELEKIEEEIAYAESFKSNILKIQPYFWAIPKYAEQEVSIDSAMKSFNYCGFKLHSGAQFWDFSNNVHKNFLFQLFQYADDHRKIILIHTGDNITCKPNHFEEFIKIAPNAKIILAHSNPISETIKMIKSYENVTCDVSFVKNEDILELKNNVKPEKILFGTDFPITAHFNGISSIKDFNLQYINDCKKLKLLDDWSLIYGKSLS